VAGPRLRATVVRQKEHSLYLFSMDSATLNRVAYVTPRSHDDPTEIQRILNPRRAREIAAYIEKAGTLLPTAVVVSLEGDVRVTPIEDNQVIIEFPEEEGKFAYVLDGQHRLAGFRESAVQFDLPVVALHGADEATRAKVFADINSKQEPITDVLILELYYQIKDLPKDESALVDVIHSLNSHEDSPLAGKIKILDDQKGTWVKNTIFKRFLGAAVKDSGIDVKSPSEQAAILKQYFRAIQRMWPEAWGNNKEYNLTRSFGLEVVVRSFPAAKARVDLNAGREYTEANFYEQIMPLREAILEIDLGDAGVVPVRLDWRREGLDFLSRGQKAREAVINQVRRLLYLADEGEDGDSASHL